MAALDAARAALFDPTTSADDLGRIAASRPDLWPLVLDHPNAYPGLVTWIQAQPPPPPPVEAPVVAEPTRPVPEYPADDTPGPEVDPGDDQVRRSPLWRLMVAAAGVVALALVAWFVVIPRVWGPRPVQLGGTWSEPIPDTSQATWVWYGGPDRVVITQEGFGTVQLVDVPRGEVVDTVTLGDGYHTLLVAAADSVAQNGSHGVAAVGSSTMPTGGPTCQVALSRDGGAWAQTRDLPGCDGPSELVWTGSVLVLSDANRSYGLDVSTLETRWVADGPANGWIGADVFSTPHGLVRASDGSPAGFGQDIVATSAVYTGTDRHVLRVSMSQDMTVQGWDRATDAPTWANPMTVSGAPQWAYDAARRDDVLFVLPSEVSGGIGPLTAYAMSDGAQLWETASPVTEPSWCALPTSRWAIAPFTAVGASAVDVVHGAVPLYCDAAQTSSPDEIGRTYLVELASGTVTATLPGYPLTSDGTGTVVVLSADARVTGFAAGGARAAWSVPLPSPDGSPYTSLANVGGLYVAGPWVSVVTDAGVRILR